MGTTARSVRAYIDKHGRVVIPADMRKALGMEPGEALTIILDGRELRMITLDEAVGKNFFDLGYPDDLAGRLQSEVQEVFETRKSLTGETSFELWAKRNVAEMDRRRCGISAALGF